MIVKNEGKIIRDTLLKLCKKVKFDYWVISDTGSTDNTIQIIKDFFEEKGIHGEMFEDEWKDFGHNRSLAINHAFQKTDYLFIFDADDEIHGDFQIPEEMNKYDAYHVYFGTENFKYLRRPIVNNRKRWRYVGVLHEVISEVDKGQTCTTIEGNYFFVSGRTSSRNDNPNKYYDDAVILEKAFKTELENPEGDVGLAHRYAYYCAQSYKDGGSKYHNKAIEWYERVLTLNNWNQEKYVSCIALGDIYKSKDDMDNAYKYWLKSIEYDNERMEGVVNAAENYRKSGNNLLVNSLYHKFRNYKKNFDDKLFLSKDRYNDILEYQNCVSAFYVNDFDTGYECCKKILLNRLLDHNTLKSTLSNMQFYKEPMLKDDDTLTLFYKVQQLMTDIKRLNQLCDNAYFNIWNELFKKNEKIFISYPNKNIISNIKNNTNPVVFLSFTTCKRLDLFQKTVNSILNQWTDYDKIDYWFCVDDNSSDEDKEKMQELYPWMDYYFKTKEEKGHRESMNIIWNRLNELKPKYWIHMEDDFLFHNKMEYIETAIKGLEHLNELNVKQILFNVNYSETIDGYNIKGDDIYKGLNTFSFHVEKEGTYNYQNNHYWPHYSFRPSLIDVETILELGNFDSENQFFEMDYAKKWTNVGYKSGFFNSINCRHIGRLTSERGDSNQTNAYFLNNESQFYSNEINIRKNKTELPFSVQSMTSYINISYESKPIKIVNLLKREDRKTRMIELMKAQKIYEIDYEFVEAVDGSGLDTTYEIKELFKGNDFGNRRGFIGCALTHLNLWKNLLNDENNDYYIILEDDVELCSNFKDKLTIIENELIDCEMLILGYHMFNEERKKVTEIYDTLKEMKSDNEPIELEIKLLNKNLYIGGTFCYSINKKGAKGMIEYIENNRIKHGIDYLNKINHKMPFYEVQPQLAFSDWNEGGKYVDTDIQNDYDVFDFTDKSKKDILEKQFVFVKGHDQINYDIHSQKPFDDCLDIAFNDKSCVGFNTLGFLKNKIVNLTTSPYFGENDGIYIKKCIYEKYMNEKNNKITITEKKQNVIKDGYIRIKMICDWCNSENLCNSFKKFCENEENYSWKNIQLTCEDTDIDYYVIINRPYDKEEYYEPNKTIVFQMEPWVYDNTKPWGVKTWGEWAEPDESKFLHVNSHKKYLNNIEWHLEVPLSELSKDVTITKLNKISTICSTKNFDNGHILRNNFIAFVYEKEPELIDVYGRFNYHNFDNYKGPLKDDNKWNGMNQYKYHIVSENNSENGYATEKIWDAILSECLCFYWGCPNLDKYINFKAFVRLDYSNKEESYAIIKKAIEEDWWSQRIDIIRREKKRIIEELSFFPNLKKIIGV
jgi:GR25 family glycosyltransferase involved in LPS biosynthesis